MAKLIYLVPTSLEGYIADETGNPNWATPDEEVFAFTCTPILIKAVATQVGSGSRLNESAKL